MKTRISVMFAMLVFAASTGCISFTQRPSSWNPHPMEDIDMDKAKGLVTKTTYFGNWEVTERKDYTVGSHRIVAQLLGTPKTGFHSFGHPGITIVREITSNKVNEYNVFIQWMFAPANETITIITDPRYVGTSSIRDGISVSGGTTYTIRGSAYASWSTSVNTLALTKDQQLAMPFRLEYTRKVVLAHVVPHLDERPRFVEINEFDTEGFDAMMAEFPELWPTKAEIRKDCQGALHRALTAQLNGGRKPEKWITTTMYGKKKGEEPVKTKSSRFPNEQMEGQVREDGKTLVKIGDGYYWCGSVELDGKVYPHRYDPEFRKALKIHNEKEAKRQKEIAAQKQARWQQNRDFEQEYLEMHRNPTLFSTIKFNIKWFFLSHPDPNDKTKYPGGLLRAL